MKIHNYWFPSHDKSFDCHLGSVWVTVLISGLIPSWLIMKNQKIICSNIDSVCGIDSAECIVGNSENFKLAKSHRLITDVNNPSSLTKLFITEFNANNSGNDDIVNNPKPLSTKNPHIPPIIHGNTVNNITKNNIPKLQPQATMLEIAKAMKVKDESSGIIVAVYHEILQQFCNPTHEYYSLNFNIMSPNPNHTSLLSMRCGKITPLCQKLWKLLVSGMGFCQKWRWILSLTVIAAKTSCPDRSLLETC